MHIVAHFRAGLGLHLKYQVVDRMEMANLAPIRLPSLFFGLRWDAMRHEWQIAMGEWRWRWRVCRGFGLLRRDGEGVKNKATMNAVCWRMAVGCWRMHYCSSAQSNYVAHSATISVKDAFLSSLLGKLLESSIQPLSYAFPICHSVTVALFKSTDMPLSAITALSYKAMGKPRKGNQQSPESTGHNLYL